MTSAGPPIPPHAAMRNQAGRHGAHHPVRGGGLRNPARQLYYRGVRLSDGASIELANAVRSSAGFDVTNPSDGTVYRIRPTSVTIVSPAGQASSEPMLEFASN